MHAGEIARRAVDALHQRRERDHGAERNLAANDQPAAEREHDRRADRLERAQQHPEPPADQRLREREALQLLGVPAERVDLGLGAVERPARGAPRKSTAFR